MAIMVGILGGDQSEIALYNHQFNSTQKKTELGEKIISYQFTRDEMGNNYQRNDFPNIVSDFFTKINYSRQEYGDIYGVVFAIAGPVKEDQKTQTATLIREGFYAEFTATQLRDKLPDPFSVIPLKLLNDMEAIGYFVTGAKDEELNSLETDQLIKVDPEQINDKAPKAIMFVGGGLGQICFIYDEVREIYLPRKEAYKPVKSEGGHNLFAPRTDEEIDLLIYLREKLKDENKDKTDEKDKTNIVSCERVISSYGLLRIYEFLRDTPKYQYTENEEVKKVINQNTNNDGSIKISPIVELIIQKACAENESDILCQKSLDLFLGAYGSCAGDLTLTYFAQGGLFLSDFNLPIEQFNNNSAFVEAFLDKEPDFREINRQIPIKIYNDQDIVFKGSAKFAIIEKFISIGKKKIVMIEEEKEEED